VVLPGLLWLVLSAAMAASNPAARTFRFDIPSQRADKALTTFAQTAGVTLVFPFDSVRRVRANQLAGEYSVADGLALLLAGTGLRGIADSPQRVTIAKANAASTDQPGESTSMKKSSIGLLALVASFFTNQTFAQSGPAAATSGSGAALAEVTVTARKREESLTNIPVAVSAFSSAKIEEIGVTSLEDLSKFSPGLSVVNQGAGFGGRLLSGIRFRGMNPTIFTPSTQVGALFIDGVYFIGGAQSVGFDDIERVEVIRGPQAAYFGRSTFGGAINYITRDPGSEFSGHISADASSYSSTALSASVEGGIIGETLTGRLSVSTREKGPQFTATDGGELGREKTESVSGTLLFRPNDALRIKFRASYSEDDDGAPLASAISYSRVGNCPPGTPQSYRNAAGAVVNGMLTLNFVCGALPYNGVRISSNTSFPDPFPPGLFVPGPGLPPQSLPLDPRAVLVDNSFSSPSLAAAPRLGSFGLLRRIERYAATFDYNINDSLTLSGALAFNEQNAYAIRDSDYSDNESVYIGSPSAFEDKSAELRLAYDAGGKVRALIGANYYEQDTTQGFANGIEATFGFRIPATGPLARPNPLQNPQGADTITTTGAFGSIDWEVLDSLTLTLEGRYQVDKVGRFSGSELIGLTREPDFESKEFLPRAIAAWRPIPGTTVYAQYSKGTLPGDNTNLATFRTLTPAQRAEVQANFGNSISESIDSEILDSYEIGLKQNLLDGRLRYSLVGYYMEWQNQKAAATIFLTADNGRTVGFRVPGDSEIKGLEFESEWAATESLDLSATLNWTDSKYTDFKLAANAAFFGGTSLAGYNAVGNTQPRFPELSGTLSAKYSGSVNADWGYFIRGDAIYTGKQFVDELNLAWVDPYTTVNFGVGFNRDSVSIQVYANNLFDEEGWATAAGGFDLSLARAITFPLQRGATGTPIDRRSFGLRASYKF